MQAKGKMSAFTAAFLKGDSRECTRYVQASPLRARNSRPGGREAAL